MFYKLFSVFRWFNNYLQSNGSAQGYRFVPKNYSVILPNTFVARLWRIGHFEGLVPYQSAVYRFSRKYSRDFWYFRIWPICKSPWWNQCRSRVSQDRRYNRRVLPTIFYSNFLKRLPRYSKRHRGSKHTAKVLQSSYPSIERPIIDLLHISMYCFSLIK